MAEKTKSRQRILIQAFIVIIAGSLAGIGSRKLGLHLPAFLNLYTGDTMWALVFFALFRAILSTLNLFSIFLITMDFAFFIELSQLWHPAWLESIRSSIWGGLLLGFGFRWTDLICYTVGCLLGWLIFSKILK